MAGSAILGTNLVDSLIPGVVDGIRDALHPVLGVRQYRVFAVTRTYAREFGSDIFSDAEVELIPQPLVEPYVTAGTGPHYTLEPCGLDEAGYIVIREVSLTYTEHEVSGCSSTALEDFHFRIIDAHGQMTKERRWTVDAPPYPDRLVDMGWKIKLMPRSAG